MEGNRIIAGLYLLCIVQLSLLSFVVEGNIEDRYIGCYYDSYNQSALQRSSISNESSLTIQRCIEQCRLLNATYAGLQNSESCMCGNNFGFSLLDTYCNSPCAGNQSQYCGGWNGVIAFYSLYSVCKFGYHGYLCDQVCHCRRQAPCDRMTGQCSNGCEEKWSGSSCNNTYLLQRYIGCFRDTADRAISTDLYSDSSMTVEFCTGRCISMNNSIAGLQAREFCSCGEMFDQYGQIDEGSCNIPCGGDPDQTCGGLWANSVYSVCPAGYYGPKCHNQCNCYNNSRCVYLTGECNSACKAGWTGKSCSIRNCSTGGGDCSENETCSAIDLRFANVARCHCLTGYGTNSSWSMCADTNECELGLCDDSTTDCINTIGSYNCMCKSGYHRNTETSCTDTDECSQQLSQCNTSISHCKNAIGSYECICEPGYENHSNDNKNCYDKNECSDIDSCDNETTMCINAIGSFVCNCLGGYQMHNDTSCKIVPKVPENISGKIAGAVIGSILGVALIAVIVFFVLRYHRRKQSKDPNVNRAAAEDTSSVSTSTLLRSDKRRVQSLFVTDDKPLSISNALNTIRSKLSDRDKLEKEFQIVPLKTKDFSALGSREELKKKNRFMNIIPYDWNRVVLSRNTDDDTSEYINASYIQGYNDSDKFIAAQGPREESVEDFWRMIIEKDIRLIVMITKLIENQKKKCEKYWPDTGQPVVCGDITVALKSEDSWPDYTVRQISATKKSHTVEIAQWHYMAWPDHGVPTDAKGFLEFRKKVRLHMLPEKYTLVHCSAGAGRTGTFIAIDYLLEQDKVDFDVDVHGCLKQMRDQRSTMIQNYAQYEFIHTALLIAFSIRDTAIPVEKFLSKFQLWQEKQSDSEKSVLEMQFQTIEETKNDDEETGGQRVWSSSVPQNKILDMDVVSIQSWRKKDAYISIKLSESPSDFWSLRKDQKCLTIIFIDETQGSEVQFLPTKTNPIALKDSTIVLESETPEDYGSHCILAECTDTDALYENTTGTQQDTGIYENVDTNVKRIQLTVLHVTESLTKRPGNADPLFALYNAVHGPNSPQISGPIMVVTRTDCSLNGFCLAAFNAFDMIRNDREVDVYQTVLNIIKSKAELFNSMASYVELHEAIGGYISLSMA